MKKQIVFVCDSYDRYQSANGLCVNLLVNAFNSFEYDIIVFCKRFGKNDKSFSANNVTIIKNYYGLEDALFNKHGKMYFFARKVFSKMRNVFFKNKWPINSPKYVKKVVKQIRSLKEQPNLIVGVSRFSDSLYVLSLFKGKVKTCSLNLDILNDPTNPYKNDYYSKKIVEYMKNCFEKIDYSVFMDYHKKWVEQNATKLSIKNIEFVGLPFLLQDPLDSKKTINKKTIMYAGGDSYLDETYLHIIDSLPDYYFYHFGQITKTKLFRELKKRNNFRYMGIVSKEEIETALPSYEFLLVFESKFLYSISSKTISYFAGRRPIICFCDSEKKRYYESISSNGFVFLDYNSSHIEIEQKIKLFNNKDILFDTNRFLVKNCAKLIIEILCFKQ